MPDISMCHGGKCPMKDKCYRYLGKPTPNWQSYFTKAPYNKKAGSCEYFWDIHPNEKNIGGIDALVAIVHGKAGRSVKNMGRDVDKHGPLDPLHNKYWDIVGNL